MANGSKSLRIRFIGTQCYELELPNGVHIITDPYITPVKGYANCGFRDFSLDEIERCDYILLTHSHWDHTSDIGELCRRFGARIFLGSMVAPDVIDFFKLGLSSTIIMNPGQKFIFDGFEMTGFLGDHIKLPPALIGDGSLKNLGGAPDGYERLSRLGTVECYNFCLTLDNNYRILMFAGTDENKDVYKIADEFRPNLLLRQIVGSYGMKWNADIIAGLKAQLTLPMHQESCVRGVFGFTMDEAVEQINTRLKDLGSQTTFFVPEPYKWYTISQTIGE